MRLQTNHETYTVDKDYPKGSKGEDFGISPHCPKTQHWVFFSSSRDRTIAFSSIAFWGEREREKWKVSIRTQNQFLNTVKCHVGC